jgi:methanethiol S-methyltransferase
MASVVTVVFVTVAYCFVHSLLAMDRTKRAVRRIAGDAAYRWYRLAYNAFAIVSALPIAALVALVPGDLVWAVPAPVVYLTMVAQVVALVVMAGSVSLVGAGDFLGLRLSSPGQTTANPGLVTAGAYRYVRHPLYSLGLVVIWLNPSMTTSGLAVSVAFSAYLVLGTFIEERRLLSVFGEQYAEYRRRTPRLIPWPQPTQPR